MLRTDRVDEGGDMGSLKRLAKDHSQVRLRKMEIDQAKQDKLLMKIQ